MRCGAGAFYTFLCAWSWHGETVGPAEGRVGTAPQVGGPATAPQASPVAGGLAQPEPPRFAVGQRGVDRAGRRQD